jgi:hypothetical protein
VKPKLREDLASQSGSEFPLSPPLSDAEGAEGAEGARGRASPPPGAVGAVWPRPVRTPPRSGPRRWRVLPQASAPSSLPPY